MSPGRLFATSDLHVGHADNRRLVERIGDHPDDWLIIAGDVGERLEHLMWTLERLTPRFAQIVWAPGNHELWTAPKDTFPLRGEQRYRALVEVCRELGALTPEDPYPTWHGDGGPVVIAPMFLLYDYTFRKPGLDRAAAMADAHEAGVVCTDEYLLHPDPYADRADWCRARVELTANRLEEIPVDLRTVLVSHWPLRREPTDVLWHPEFAQWCGSTATADWHLRFRADVAVYGHLHIPRTTEYDGVRFEEVSIGYPREWRKYARDGLPRRGLLRQILPRPA